MLVVVLVTVLVMMMVVMMVLVLMSTLLLYMGKLWTGVGYNDDVVIDCNVCGYGYAVGDQHE